MPAGQWIARIACWNEKAVYGLLIKASAQTVMTNAADPKRLGVRVGITSVLHTSRQRRVCDTTGSALTHHPQIHMIVPGGGLSPDGTRWIACKAGFFLHVRARSHLFRRLFLEGLMGLQRSGQLAFLDDLAGLADARAFIAWLAPFRKTGWVVYAKPPFGGPDRHRTSPISPIQDLRSFHLGRTSNAGHSRTVWKSCTIHRIRNNLQIQTFGNAQIFWRKRPLMRVATVNS